MTKRSLPPPTPAFTARKSRILSSLALPQDTYTDKSPKGSVDGPIIDLIDELNGIDGVVTTSSCSGRVAVFVEGEGPKLTRQDGRSDPTKTGSVDDREAEDDEEGDEGTVRMLTGSPAGKGGGQWLFVSHDPIDIPTSPPDGFFTNLCGLAVSYSSHRSRSASRPSDHKYGPTPSRLIKLSFSPLILHVQCSSLHHAKPLLTAAINAGFRESGVQSLRLLDDPDAGVTLGIRTAGLGFETVIGRVSNRESADGIAKDEVYESIVSEDYLSAMVSVVNERFEWNSRRKERLRGEVRRLFALDGGDSGEAWEDKDARRKRKREEGLRRQKEKQKTRDDEVATNGGSGGAEEVGASHEERELGNMAGRLEAEGR